MMNQIPRSEYPRPQFFRASWQNLNGPWGFSFDFGNSGEARGLFKPEASFPETITVPFCPESRLSGLENKDFLNSVWYRRTVSVSAAQLQGRVLLHFGAVDYLSTVYVNGERCGTHRGGYSSFCFDISAFLKEGENVLTVHAEDDLRSGRQPRGKQCANYFSRGCDYTRTTGIWQTVWLEFVPKVYLAAVHVQTDYRGVVSFDARLSGETGDYTLQTDITFQGKPVASCRVPLTLSSTQFSLSIDDPKLWDAGQPNLYDVAYRLFEGKREVDAVVSYFGIRTIELKSHGIWLNGRPLYQRLVLDQGFYPDGIYTAPTDEDLKKDILLSMDLGFNGARLHQKVFEERFLYWADRLGYLVWGEQASWGLDHTKIEALADFLPEWLEVLERDRNHPGIVGWCPFNETWDRNHAWQDDRVLEIVYRTTKAVDGTRPVIDTSGNFHVVTDIFDTHDYDQDVALFSEHYAGITKEKIFDHQSNRQTYGGQPFFVSEYGGAIWAPERKDGWGYGNAPKTEEEFADRYAGLTTALLKNENICAFCYTQLYDIEQEQNGLYTYERKTKFAPAVYDRIREANRTVAGIEKTVG